MPQAKKKQSTKTAKKTTAKKTTAARTTSRKACTKTNCKQDNHMRNHIYIVTALSMVALILLCADAAMLMM